MNRVEFESRLQQLLDDRRSPSLDVELMRAAESDADLRQLLAAYELAVGTYSASPPIPAGLSERVLSEWQPAPQLARSGLPSWFAPMAAVAATLVIATGIAFLAQGRRDENTANRPVQDAQPVAQLPGGADAPRLD